MAAKHGLGRGFESLIPADLIDDSFDPNAAYDPTAAEDQKVSRQKTVPLAQLHANADQPRRYFDEVALQELAASIKEHGIIQPLIVTPDTDGFQIVAGERRYRAAQIAGFTEVPVIIRSLSNQNQLEIALIENIQRRDLNAVETAAAYAKLRDQFNLTHEQIAERVHKSVSSITNSLRLLTLPKEVLQAVADGQLNEGQARPLIGQDEALLQKIVPKIISEGWSARKVEQYMVNLKRLRAETPAMQGSLAGQATLDAEAEHRHEANIQALRTKLGTPVDIRVNHKGAGKIVIPFKDAEDFERLRHLLDS